MTGLAEPQGVDPSLVPRLLRESFELVAECGDKVAAHFYALIFLEHPEVRDMFPPMMDGQRDRLIQALAWTVSNTEEPEALTEYLRGLGRDHRKFGAQPEHYDVVWRSLITALKRFAGPGWTPDMDQAWLAAYEIVAGTMIAAADEASQSSPAWWTGRVVGHELRARDIAVVTVLPDQPYPFRPGQYATLETQRWPRVWRNYSMANAPRPDGTLTFHVRAIPAGWVSNALVNHTRVGDLLRLGPPLGTMLCNTASARPVLCIAGGTGLAPIKAIVEDMAGWNTNRQVRLFVGGRRVEDLYDSAALSALVDRCPWLSVVSATSDEPRFPGERGTLPMVVARHGEFHHHWAGHDVYVAGSAPMVRATIARLQELDIPLAQIRFDAYGETGGIWQPGGGAAVAEPVVATGSVEDADSSVGSYGRAPQANGAQHGTSNGVQNGTQHSAPNGGPNGTQASKSSSTLGVNGRDWQASTNPSAFSSGSKA